MPVHYSIRANSISSFLAPSEEQRFEMSLNQSLGLRSNHRPKSEMSKKARKRIRNAINWLTVLSSKRNAKISQDRYIYNFQISFVTLTLPSKQMHSHQEIKSQCLNRFLTEMRRKFGVQNYVWKLELQKNGNAHFHLTFDKFVHYRAIRYYWNQAIAKLGYIEAYKKAHQNLTFQEYCYWRRQNGVAKDESLAKSYKFGKSNNWTSPNTTDVKNVKDVKNLASYLSKYLTKDPIEKDKTGIIADSADELTGRLWYLSSSLSRLKSVVLKFSLNTRNLFRKLKSLRNTFKVASDYSETVFFSLSKLPKMLKEFLNQELVSFAISMGYPFPAALPKF